MAAIAMVLGGTFGFFSALISLIVLNLSWAMALAVWSGVGFGVAVLLMVWALAPKAVPSLKTQRV